MELLRVQNAAPMDAELDVYFVVAGEQAQAAALPLAERLRDGLPGLRMETNCGGGSFKSQMKKADASGARYAIIVGDDEAQAQQVSIKPLRESAEQARCTVAQALNKIRSE